MSNQLREAIFISLLTLIFAGSAFAEFENNAATYNFFQPAGEPVFSECFAAESSRQSNWTNWTAMNDGRSNGVSIRWKRGSFKFEGGNYEVFWQLHNRYRRDVRLSYKLTFRKADGSTFTTSEVTELDAGEVNDSLGLHNIAYALVSYQVKEIEFTDD